MYRKLSQKIKNFQKSADKFLKICKILENGLTSLSKNVKFKIRGGKRLKKSELKQMYRQIFQKK